MTKKQKSFLAVLVTIFVTSICFNCSLEPSKIKKTNSVTIISWNVQTFFDSQIVGTEYSDFKKKDKWNQNMYIARIERLCDSIKMFDADILVFQEIENKAVMYDIVNFLSGNLARNKNYDYMCFAKDNESAIGCGILSRFPLGTAMVHQLDSRVNGSQPSLRPLLEIVVKNTEIDNSDLFTLIVCHWKSKSGGEEVASLWQKEQEKILARRVDFLTKSKIPVVICGDFNKDIDEFEKNPHKSTDVLMNSISVTSGWLFTDENNTEQNNIGSYWYKEKWEKIDHFFVNDKASIDNFNVIDTGPWAVFDDMGNLIPYRFSLWNGAGYSDHFPLECTVSF